MTQEEAQRQQAGSMMRPAPAPPKPEDEAFLTLKRYGFAVLFIENAPPVVLVDPDRVLMAVLK